MNESYALALILSAVVSTIMAAVAWRRRAAPGATALAVTMLALIVWAVTYAVRWSVTDLAGEYFWLDATYLGVVFVPPAFLIFALQFTNRARLLTRRNLVLLAIEPVLTLFILFTDQWHGLFYAGMRSTGSIFNGGPWFWVNVVYSYTLFLITLGLLIQAFVRAPYLYRQQTGVVLVGMLLPFVSNIVSLAKLVPFPNLDITPFVFILTGLVFAYGLFRLGLLDIVPIARSRLIESMSDGVIVLDVQYRIVDMNPTAQKIIGSSQNWIGKPASSAFAPWPNVDEAFLSNSEAQTELQVSQDPPRVFDVRSTALLDHKQVAGWLIILRDITDRKKVEVKLQYQSTHDALTGLFNRQYYETELERLQQSRLFPVSILVMDVDNLKRVNDLLGHNAGDELLRRVAQVLKNTFRPEDLVARIGGDEFVVVLPNTDGASAARVVGRLKNRLAEENQGCSADQIISLSTGYACGEENTLLSEVFKLADTAMYREKADRKDPAKGL